MCNLLRTRLAFPKEGEKETALEQLIHSMMKADNLVAMLSMLYTTSFYLESISRRVLMTLPKWYAQAMSRISLDALRCMVADPVPACCISSLCDLAPFQVLLTRWLFFGATEVTERKVLQFFKTRLLFSIFFSLYFVLWLRQGSMLGFCVSFPKGRYNCSSYTTQPWKEWILWVEWF